jgi:hypothetical protein
MFTKILVLFEDPYWVGLFEKIDNGYYSAARWVFGSEPTDLEVYMLILNRNKDIVYSKPIKTDDDFKLQDISDINPKRRQRLASKELKANIGIKKAYDAIKMEKEKNKLEKKKITHDEKEKIQKMKFELKQIKKKEKHKGH